MKSTLMTILTMICSILGCYGQSFSSVDVTEFAKVIKAKSVIILDVRTAEEYAEGHIKGAKNIDVLKDSFEKEALKALPKGKTIALYCRSGRRSKTAAEVLSKKGYKVIELNTGYLGWTGAGKENVK